MIAPNIGFALLFTAYNFVEVAIFAFTTFRLCPAIVTVSPSSFSSGSAKRRITSSAVSTYMYSFSPAS